MGIRSKKRVRAPEPPRARGRSVDAFVARAASPASGSGSWYAARPVRVAALLLLGACGGGGAPADARACGGARALACDYFDGAARAWSPDAPRGVSIGEACGEGGLRGEVAARVVASAPVELDRIGFAASGAAVRVPGGALASSDDAGGAPYACGDPAPVMITQLLCGRDVGAGTLSLRFSFAGRWSDGTAWTQDCAADVDVTP